MRIAKQTVGVRRRGAYSCRLSGVRAANLFDETEDDDFEEVDLFKTDGTEMYPADDSAVFEMDEQTVSSEFPF